MRQVHKTALFLLAALALAAMFFLRPPGGKPQEEIVTVKYRGSISLARFDCAGIDQPGIVRRVCYNATGAYMLIQLNGTWYHYCGIDNATVAGLKASASASDYYMHNIKHKFDCRKIPPPF